MQLIKIVHQYNNYRQHILELQDDVHLITTTLDKKGQCQVYQFIVCYKKKITLHTTQLNIQLKMAPFIQTSMMGYVFDQIIGCFIGSHNGRVFQIQEGAITEYSIGTMAINQIGQITESLVFFNCESGQINLFHVGYQQTLLIFNEYLSTPLKYFQTRFFVDTFVQGKQDGQLTFFKFNESIRLELSKKEQEGKAKINSISLINQADCRLHVTGSKMLDFELYGDVVITLQANEVQFLYVDILEQQFIRLRTFQINKPILNLQIHNDQLILYGQEIYSMDMNKGEMKLLHNTPGKFNNLITYIQDDKILYK